MEHSKAKSAQDNKNSDAEAKKTTDTSKMKPEKMEKEIGGYESQGLPEPTRFGDWEVKGRCSDF